MSKFLFIPKPLPEESPSSMLKRMGIKHGCLSSSSCQHLFGSSWYHSIPLSKSHPIIQNIAIHAGEAGEDFLNGFYSPIGILESSPPLIIAGVTVEADMIRKSGAAYCSECWREGHEHFIKDLKLASCCPYHNRKYLTQCPNCLRNLHWYDSLVEKCRCNHILISPSCTFEEAKNERKLLSIFRSGASEDFQHLMSLLKKLGYPLADATQRPADGCIKSIAFCILEDDMTGLTANLRKLACFFPEIPKRILAAKLARFNDIKIRKCVYEFIKQHDVHAHENSTAEVLPTDQFYLTRPQILAWLKIPENQWSSVINTTDTRSKKFRYSLKEAQAIGKKVLSIKLKNGFKKTKKAINRIFHKDFEERFLLSKGIVKSLLDEHILTRQWDRHRIFFDSHEVESFSNNFISIRLLSSQTKIPEKRIRIAIALLEIPPLRFLKSNLNFHLTTIQTSHLVIEWCKNNAQSTMVRPKYLSSSLKQYIPQEGETWLSTPLAARYLKINSTALQSLVKTGLLRNIQKRGLGGGYYINTSILNEFNEQYVNTTEAGRLLGCSYKKASKLVRSIGIEPVTGPGIDNNNTIFYPRKKVLLYANTTSQLRETKIGYTVSEACKKLNIDKAMVANLIKTGLLNFVDSTFQCYGLINRSDVDTFNERYANTTTVANWLEVHITCVFRILSQLAITPVCGPPVDTSMQRFYAIKDIKKYFSIPDRKKPSNHKQHPPLVKVPHLLKKYGIGPVSFGRLFLSSGFATPIKIRYITYIIQSDANKIERILNKYCTPLQGDRYLNERKCTRHLLKTKKIKTYYPLKEYCEYPMIKKSELHDYIVNHLSYTSCSTAPRA